MKVSIFSWFGLVVVALIVKNEVTNCAKVFPDFMRGHMTAIAGIFPVKKNDVLDELKKRIPLEDSSYRDMEFGFEDIFDVADELSPDDHVMVTAFVEYEHLTIDDSQWPANVSNSFSVKEKYLWMFVPFIKVGQSLVRVFCYACFTDSQKGVFLPNFGENIYRVDSLTLDEQIGSLTLINGSDSMTIKMNRDSECHRIVDRLAKDEWRDVRHELMFPLSAGGFNWDICDTLSGCQSNLCRDDEEAKTAISEAGEDYCALLGYRGPNTQCEATMEITNITGTFRDVSMLDIAEMPKRAITAEYLDGGRSITIVTNCLASEAL